MWYHLKVPEIKMSSWIPNLNYYVWILIRVDLKEIWLAGKHHEMPRFKTNTKSKS